MKLISLRQFWDSFTLFKHLNLIKSSPYNWQLTVNTIKKHIV